MFAIVAFGDRFVSTTCNGPLIIDPPLFVTVSVATQSSVARLRTKPVCVTLTRADTSVNVTTYTYDLLNNLSQVSMPRPTGTQTRTFVYSGPYLMSATNPENGTVSYTYNSIYKVATKTDAKGQQVQYT